MGSVAEVNKSNWEQEVLESKMLTVVDFWHDRCPWCLRFNPVIDEVAEEYKGKIRVLKLNVLASPENRTLAVSHGIMGTPTLIFFCDGRPIESVAGYMPKERLEKTLNDVIEKHRDCVKQSTALKA